MDRLPEPFDMRSIAEIVERERFGVLATVSPNGAPEAALIGMVATTAGEIVFDTPDATAKFRNLQHEPRVAIVLGTGPGPMAVQVEGRARVVEGYERVQYEQVLATRFGPQRVENPGWAVVVVRPEWARSFDLGERPPKITPAVDAQQRPSSRTHAFADFG